LSAELAAARATRLGEEGYREIVVTGIEISSYGGDLTPRASLIDVLRAASDAAPDARLRLGSMDPGYISRDFCGRLRGVPGICDHFHLSLQSGCDDTLRRMGRKYDTDAASDAILSLRSLFPDCGVTADLIVGFPGETDREFGQTLEFIRSSAFSSMHIFPFSPRPGTRAAGMQGQVSKSVRRERAAAASSVASEMAHDFRAGQVGKVVRVLFERERGGSWVGHSGNYLEVAVQNGGARNSLQPVLITGFENGVVTGVIDDYL